MRSISHREFRNQSGEVLRRAEAGESLLITSSGRAVAVVGPVGRNELDEGVERGHVRRASRGVDGLRLIARRRSSVDSSGIIEDSRGRW